MAGTKKQTTEFQRLQVRVRKLNKKYIHTGDVKYFEEAFACERTLEAMATHVRGGEPVGAS